MSKFDGVSCAITGGADGIGLGLARALGKRGACVALLDIRADAAAEAADGLRELGIKAISAHCDVTDRSTIEAAAAQVVSAFGGVGLMWANAGVGAGGNLATAPIRRIDWVYAVNVKGMIDTAQVFWPLIEKAEGVRHVGFTASSNTLFHIPAGPLDIYPASKWAALGIAEGVSAQAMAAGIGATIFCPGLLDTRIWDGARARPEKFGGPAYQPEEAGEHWRTTGMPVDWACEVALDAAEAGQLYACPVEPRVAEAFETRVANVRAGFVTP
jgi:NAD(P)-dependent dehydrogenase (short-subunit alcohol dehydrogenase family)